MEDLAHREVTNLFRLRGALTQWGIMYVPPDCLAADAGELVPPPDASPTPVLQACHSDLSKKRRVRKKPRLFRNPSKKGRVIKPPQRSRPVLTQPAVDDDDNNNININIPQCAPDNPTASAIDDEQQQPASRVQDFPISPDTHSPSDCASAIFAKFLEEIYSEFPNPRKYIPRSLPRPPKTMKEFEEHVTSYIVKSSLALRPAGWTTRFNMFLGPNNAASAKGKWRQGWQQLKYGESLAAYRDWAKDKEQDRSAELEEFDAQLKKLFNELEVLPLSSPMSKLWTTKKPDPSCTTAHGTGVCVVKNEGDPPPKQTKKGGRRCGGRDSRAGNAGRSPTPGRISEEQPRTNQPSEFEATTSGQSENRRVAEEVERSPIPVQPSETEAATSGQSKKRRVTGEDKQPLILVPPCHEPDSAYRQKGAYVEVPPIDPHFRATFKKIRHI